MFIYGVFGGERGGCVSRLRKCLICCEVARGRRLLLRMSCCRRFVLFKLLLKVCGNGLVLRRLSRMVVGFGFMIRKVVLW